MAAPKPTGIHSMRSKIQNAFALAMLISSCAANAVQFEQLGTPHQLEARKTAMQVESDSYGVVNMILPPDWTTNWPTGFIATKSTAVVPAGETWLGALHQWARSQNVNVSIDWNSRVASFYVDESSVEPVAPRTLVIEAPTPVGPVPGPVVESAPPQQVAQPDAAQEPTFSAINMVNAPSTEAPPEVKDAPVAQIYHFIAGQKFSKNIGGWLKREGWTLIWKPAYDWQIPADTQVSAMTALDAIEIVSTWVAAEGQPVRFRAYEGNKIVIADSFGPANPNK